MRTDSHRLTATLVAIAFLGGWISASWVSPPTAVTQVRPPRPVVAPPDVPMPHIALDAVTAPHTTPATSRNPFAFSTGRLDGRDLAARSARPRADGDGVPAESPGVEGDAAPLVTGPAVPAWRVFGIAQDADDRYTAVVSGGGEVFLLGMGDRLPDGFAVVEIDATGVVMADAAGARLTLRLP